MTDGTEPDFNDERNGIRERAKAAGIRYLNAHFPDPEATKVLILYFSDGDISRSVAIDGDSAPPFNALPFESLQIVGPYRSLYDAGDQSLEAAIIRNPLTRLMAKAILQLPGAERLEHDSEGNVIASPLNVDAVDPAVLDLEEENLRHTAISA